MTWTLFLGLMLILMGSSLIIKIVFDIDLPLAKIFIAGILIYIGVRILIGHKGDIFRPVHTENTIIFSQGTVSAPEDGREYSVIFGQCDFDLASLPDTLQHPCRIRINTIFGSSKLLNYRHLPLRIVSDAAFANVVLPDGRKTVFGSSVFQSDTFDLQKPYVELEINTVFGEFVMP